MKKYVKFSVAALVMLGIIVTLVKPSKTPHTYLCMTPLTPLGGIEFDTSSAQVQDEGSTLKLTTEEGNSVIVPKTLCIEVIRANGN